MAPHDPAARDAALRRLRRARAWIAVAAVALTGLATAAAATSFRGHQTAAAASDQATTTPRPATSGPDAIPVPGADDRGLQPPAQAPQPAQPGTPPATTSGGS